MCAATTDRTLIWAGSKKPRSLRAAGVFLRNRQSNHDKRSKPAIGLRCGDICFKLQQIPQKARIAPWSEPFSPRIADSLSYQAGPIPRILRLASLPVRAGTGGSSSLLIPRRRREMAKGTVKWFNPTKGYGFIQPSTGGKDVFVHISAVEKAGLSTLNEGQTLEYEEVANRGKTSAENLKV
jgi:CspA family cold shock protein